MIEVRIAGMGKAGVQVFRAETESKMIEVLREAQRHSTRKIRELSTLVKILTGLILDLGKSEAWLRAAIEKWLNRV